MKLRNDVSVGIFFFIALFILGYFTIIMREEIFSTHEFYKMTVFFKDTGGLGVNDKVKINGVLSGIVEDIQLESNEVKVTLKMHNKFTLYENYEIRIQSETTLAGKCVNIYPGNSFHEGKSYAVIESRENLKGMGMGDIMVMMSDLIYKNRDNIYKTINNLREITEKINTGKGTMGRLINENTVHENTDGMISEIRDTLEDAREQAPVTSFIRAALTAF